METSNSVSNTKPKNGGATHHTSSTESAATESSNSFGSLNMHLAYSLAIVLRLLLLSSDEDRSLTNRVELATPLNSFGRLTEGVTLWRDHKIDPYSGVIFHETPLTLYFFSVIPSTMVPSLFILIDVIAALIIGYLARQMAKYYLQEQCEQEEIRHEDATELSLNPEELDKIERRTQLAYLFHPYLVANCAAKTTTTITNLILVIFLLAMIKRKRTLACLFLSLATYQCFYPVMLIFPLCICLAQRGSSTTSPTQIFSRIVLPTVLTFLFFFGILNVISYELMGKSWTFLGSTHGFILSVPELTPNIGLFWYFFTEMFEHFRLFFVWTFQLNCFIYVMPLSIQFRRHPFLLAWTLIALTAIFKSYPSYGDVGLYLALLPILAHLFPYMKQMFIVGNMFLAATVLGPVLYQMWIYNGSANSNYFFAINLVFGTAQIFLVTDLLFAQIKREFYLKNGFKALQPTGDPQKDLKLVMK